MGVRTESESTGVHAQALAGLPSLATAAARLPPVHVDEDDERFTIIADVPGLGKDDIKVRGRHRCHRRMAWLWCACACMFPDWDDACAAFTCVTCTFEDAPQSM